MKSQLRSENQNCEQAVKKSKIEIEGKKLIHVKYPSKSLLASLAIKSFSMNNIGAHESYQLRKDLLGQE